MLILGDKRFIKESFSSEEEIEKVVTNNYEYIFGPSSIYFPKILITTIDGIGTIPDGFVIDISLKQWFIVEAELAVHSVWSHIAPQVAKQISAVQNINTKKKIAKLMVDTIKKDDASLEKFKNEEIHTIDIHQAISEIVDKSPIVGLPIDHVSNDLKVWATTLKAEVRLWEIKKYVQFKSSTVIMYEFPEDSRPVFDTKMDESETPDKITQYDVSVLDLVNEKLLAIGEKLFISYKPASGKKQDFEAIIQENGSIMVLDQTFTSPSYAALFCINKAGSPRKTTNGWTGWKNESGKTLADLRNIFIASKTEKK
jgi:hypothetical protein